MAQEIKNTFLKSKMNKDLDDRILPNGEYRDARNISVGRSEDNDVGALENIIGNDLVTGTNVGNGLTIIGIEADNASDKLFVFLTNYEDSDPKNPTNAPAGSKHYIYSYDNSNGNYKRLVQGEFLNFSKTNRIIGINLIEKLLFWTDNRNQPRKINIDLARTFTGGLSTADGDYYQNEHQISVAKYSPYAPIDLYNRIDLQVISGATQSYFQIAGHRETELKKYIGATVICTEAVPPTQGSSYVKVKTVKNFIGPVTRITVSPDMPAAPAQDQFVSLISSTMSNKNDDDSWPGDPDFLEDKFVRFSYRFKFDDNEYSLMAPFTQIAYIPKQRGYFINGDENAAYQSTVVSFMENLVQNVGLVIPLPTSANRLIRDYKINEMEILFRESDGVAVKVLDSVSVGDISGASGIDSYYNYEYQSRKPYRTLPEAQTVRVYDKVPVRALAQESSGNRIIYGNFTDQYTPPANINYNCRIDPKSDTGLYNNFIEYPSHSVKRNRNYQIGFVLADKFGRQSPVILSSVDKGATSSTGSFFSGSTIYSPYDSIDTNTDVLSWNGDAIKVLVNEPISSKINYNTGTPGLYALKEQYSPNTGTGFAVSFWLGTQITNSSYTFRANTTFSNNQNIPRVGDYMRGAYQDFVKVTAISGPTGPNQYTVTTDGRVSDIYLTPKNLGATTPDLKFVYSINDLGWYSYKIVVKQTEQDYYNVYLPGILNGYPGQSGKEKVAPATSEEGGIDEGVFPNEINLTAHTVLFNDNINKVPRDLAEVGPDQKQYRSSVVLYGRVTNLMEQIVAGDPTPNNQQYFPRLNSEGKSAVSHMSTAIAQARDFNMGFRELSDIDPAKYTGGSDGNKVFYEISSNPLIARITTTEKSIGQPNIDTPDPNATPVVNPSQPYNMLPYLAIYETDPVESLLDIYWETSDAGLIVDLNAEVASTNGNVTGFSGLTWEFDENTAAPSQPVTSFFTPVDNQGQTIVAGITAQLTSQSNPNGDVELFALVAAPPGPEFGNFQIIYTGDGIVFDSNSASNDVYSFDITVINNNFTEPISTIVTLTGTPGGFGSLRNIAPSFTPIPDKEISPSTEILISEAEWTTANPNNGSIFPNNTKEGLKYSFEPFDAVNNIPPINWNMDEDTGVLIQETGVNALGTYKIKVIVADASLVGGGDGSDYESLATEQLVLTFTSLPANVNEGAITEKLNGQPNFNFCKTNPVASNGQGQLSPNDIGASVGMVYYITENELPGALPPQAPSNTGQEFFNQGIKNPASVSTISPTQYPIQLEGTNLYCHRIGTDAHRSGTITFGENLTFPPATANEVGLERKNITCPSVLYYYRYTGETQWRALPRSIEKNKVGQAGYNNIYSQEYSGGNPVYSPTLDFPYFDSYGATPTSNPKFKMLRNISDTTIWLQAIRAYAYDDFAGTQGESEEPVGIEYAIVFSGFARGFNSNSSGRPVAWLVADDFNYPKCVPWNNRQAGGGVNAVIKNGSTIGNSFSTSTYNLFKFYRSDASSNSSEYRKVGTDVADELYGRHPWGDYNDQFYTDAINFTPFTGTAADPYYNIRLDRNLPGVAGQGVAFELHPYSETYLFEPIPPNTFPPNDGSVQPKEINLQWAIGISETGVKLSNPNSTTGVSAIQTSQKFEDPPGVPETGASGINEYPSNRGTLRIYRNTYN